MTAGVIVVKATSLSTRHTARRVPKPSDTCWDSLALRAIAEGCWIVAVHHGGTVANSYGYRASTECVLVAASPIGEVALWYGVVSANRATLAGAAHACLPVAGDAFDKRCGDDRKAAARALVIKTARALFGYGSTSDDVAVARAELIELDNRHVPATGADTTGTAERYAALELS